VRIAIIGAGLAGCTLAWRFSLAGPAVRLDVFGRTGPDATSASGGGVRGYEPDASARALAVASLAELLASATLRRWARFSPLGSTYLRAPWTSAEDDVAQIEAQIPGAELVGAAQLRERGWAFGQSDGPEPVGVVETRAGCIDPNALRTALMRELSARANVRVRSGPAELTGPTRVSVRGQRADYDVVVVAAGPWTPRVIAGVAGGAGDLRVKAIQYAVHTASGRLPTFFVDEITGLYGRPHDRGGVLLGLPVTRFGGAANGGRVEPALVDTARARAAERFPGLRLGPVRRVVRAADCYGPSATLTLQAVGDRPGLYTFSAGSGASAKTALAASRDAASRLLTDSAAWRPGAEGPVRSPRLSSPPTTESREVS
jgi:glycine/D-amino acid oxidase-like deaminating enzyme